MALKKPFPKGVNMRIKFLISVLVVLNPSILRAEEVRARARDLGIIVGSLQPGKLNAITDVAGVLVGQVTINEGNGPTAARTGVTAILPAGDDLWNKRVPAATYIMNGSGEMTGTTWLNTQGALDVPILLTNTMNIPRVSDGVLTYMLQKYLKIGRSDDVVIPVVTECDDSTLNDARGRHVTSADALKAIETAKSGPVEEGSVGAGTGMVSYGFKGGIGTASRVLAASDGGWTLGVLVNANMGRRLELRVAGAPAGLDIREFPLKATDGSIIVVIATDAPLDHLKLQRLAARASVGVVRTGSTVRHGSGDIFVAFSTGNRIPHSPKESTYAMRVVDDDHLNAIFEAAEDATEEAILNALTTAKTIIGRDGNTAYAIPLDHLRAVVAKYSRSAGSR
jgi:D-aminopeptidase